MPITTIDYVTKGIDRWPELTRGEKAMKYLAVYLQSIQDSEEQLADLLNAFVFWYVPSRSYTFVLDIVGEFFLGQPRPAEFAGDDENYRLLLLARTIARTSSGNEASVVRLVDYLARINGGSGDYNVTSGPPEHWVIDLYGVNLSPIWQALYVRLIFDTIGAVDSFDLSVNGNGASRYDDETQGYDVALYG